MGRCALLLVGYWMGHIHWTVWELEPQLGPQIKEGWTFKSFECLWLLPSEKEQECTMMDQRGWILSAYHKVEEAKLKLVEKKSKLEKELCDLQGWLFTL